MAYTKYEDYYRHFGIRRSIQLAGPPLSSIMRMTLPQSSVLHFPPTGDTLGIAPDDPLLHDYHGPVYVHSELKLTGTKGNPRSSNVSPSKMIREYFKRFRVFRQLTALERGVKDPRSLVVNNYALLAQLYRYTPTIFRPYYNWYNQMKTVFDGIASVSKVCNRQQYIECYLPPMLLGPGLLNKASVNMSASSLSHFADRESLFILEVWKWLGPHRDQSLFHDLDSDALSRLNLIWRAGDKFFVMNMGLIDSWEKDPTDKNAKGIAYTTIQARFLRALMFLQETTTAQGGEAKPLEEDAVRTENDVRETVDGDPLLVKVESPHTEDQGEDLTLKLKINMDLRDFPIEELVETDETKDLIDSIIAKDLETLDALNRERIGEDARELEELGAAAERELNQHSDDPLERELPEEHKFLLTNVGLEEAIMAKADQLASQDMLSAAEYRRMIALSKEYKNLPNVYSDDESSKLIDELVINPKDLKIEDDVLADHIHGVFDKSMLKSSLKSLDSKYIKHVMHKDIGNMVMHVQKAGYAVTSYSTESHTDAVNDYIKHSIQYTPLKGKPSMVHFHMPKVSEDGTFVANGSKYRTARQRFDLPFRKTKPDQVALSSYYGKSFISRSEKKVSDWSGWIVREIKRRDMDSKDDSVTMMVLANVYNSYHHVPRIYSTLAGNFRSFNSGDLHFIFDYETRVNLVDEGTLKRVEGKGYVLCGMADKGQSPIIVGNDNIFYKVQFKGSDIDLVPLGSMETILNLDTSKMPGEVAEIMISGKLVPVGIYLAYMMGFRGLLNYLKVKPNRVLMQGERATLASDEYMITFLDERYVFTRGSTREGLILQGIATYNDVLANYSAYLYDRKAIYHNVMERMRFGPAMIREMEMITDLFVDPITLEILKSRHEPETFVGLVIKACDALTTDWSPDEVDIDYQRLRGYERFAGAVYSELVDAIRAHRRRNNPRVGLEVNPKAVWMKIVDDSANRQVEESNPIHELKGVEEITFSGTGGRSGRSMVAGTRVMTESDKGKISEATKDSGDVAITTYTSADPHISDLRGLTYGYNPKTSGPASLLSTSVLLAAGSDYDDMRRAGFVSIQNSQTTHVKHQRPMPVRTGMEKVIAHRTSDLFGTASAADGKVTKVTPLALEITYDDGTKRSVELGRRFGSVAGITVPHDVVTDLKVGDTVKKADIVSWSHQYFERDPLDKRQTLWKMGVLFDVAMVEASETFEDASAITKEAAQLLETELTKIRPIIVDKTQAVHDLVAVGTVVNIDSILCTLEDPITADQRHYDDDSLETLRRIKANNPKAKMAGRVEKVEVFYNVPDIDEMSPSLLELARASDMDRRRQARALGRPYTSGFVGNDYRIEGAALLPGQVAIRVYITIDVPMGIGDKGVFGNQLKTVVSRVIDGKCETEDGRKIQAYFSWHGVESRIVNSPVLLGMAASLQSLVSRRFAAMCRGQDPSKIKH